MREITSEENKIILIDMLQAIHDFCSVNHIQYSLAYGTLLGCIRHQGFIPWDDDIDLLMPRRDFELFEKSFNQVSEKYQLVSLNNTAGYDLLVAKVINTDTSLIEDVEEPLEIGVYIDIFILDYLPDDAVKQKETIKKLKKLRKEYVLKTVKIRKGRSFYKNMILTVAHAALKPLKTYNILRKMDLIAKNASATASKKCGALSSFVYEEKEIMESDWYNNYELGAFEGRQFYIPTAYDEILTNLYGNYMTPPPKELQVTHHSNKAFWRE